MHDDEAVLIVKDAVDDEKVRGDENGDLEVDDDVESSLSSSSSSASSAHSLSRREQAKAVCKSCGLAWCGPEEDDGPIYNFVALWLQRICCIWWLNCLPSCITNPALCLTPWGLKRTIRKYFCVGSMSAGGDVQSQIGFQRCGCFCLFPRATRKAIKEDPSVPLIDNYLYIRFIHYRPRWVALLLPAFIWWPIWLTLMSYYDNWHMYSERPPKPKKLWPAHNSVDDLTFDQTHFSTPGWVMALVMLLGSMVAGATSEGGGSVAFPFMTLVFGLPPNIARDFSFLIQSVGMTGAAFTNIYSRITMEWNSIVWSSIGASAGVCLGVAVIAPLIPPPATKMMFVSVFLAFSTTLLILNRMKRRRCYTTLGSFEELSNPRRVALIITGLCGGIVSGLTGSGTDICSFAALSLLFRISEKTATPTSVVLMAINTLVGTWFVVFITESVAEATVWYWWCASPIVVLGAPMGALISSFLHRQVLATFVYAADYVQFIAAVIIVVPVNPGLLLGIAIGTCLAFMACFGALALVGQILLWRDIIARRLVARRKRRRKEKRRAARLAGKNITELDTYDLPSSSSVVDFKELAAEDDSYHYVDDENIPHSRLDSDSYPISSDHQE